MKTDVAAVLALMTPEERFVAVRLEDWLKMVMDVFPEAGPRGVLSIWRSKVDQYLEDESLTIWQGLRAEFAEEPSRAMSREDLSLLIDDGLRAHRGILKVLRLASQRTGVDFDGEGVWRLLLSSGILYGSTKRVARALRERGALCNSN